MTGPMYAEFVLIALAGLFFFTAWVQCLLHGHPDDRSLTGRVIRAGYGLCGLAAGGLAVAALLKYHLG